MTKYTIAITEHVTYVYEVSAEDEESAIAEAHARHLGDDPEPDIIEVLSRSDTVLGAHHD